jgi:hypothetical protein
MAYLQIFIAFNSFPVEITVNYHCEHHIVKGYWHHRDKFDAFLYPWPFLCLDKKILPLVPIE